MIRSGWFWSICLAAGVTGTTTGQSSAETDAGHWYGRAGLGPEWTQNSAVTLNFSAPSVEAKFDPGIRVDLAGGYRFTPWLGVEAETGLIYNSISSIAGSPDTDARIYEVPCMVNLVFQLPGHSRFVPYVGAGGGLALYTLDVDQATVQGSNLHGSDTAHVAGGQAFVGCRYALTDRIQLGCEYKFTITTPPEWDLPSLDSTKTFGVFKLQYPRQHSLQIEFIFNF